MSQACIEEISHRFIPRLNEIMTNEINKNTDFWTLKIDDNDPQTILFYYPRSMDTGLESYIQPVIKIEMGARSDDWPTINGIVSSYIEETFKDLWPKNPINIKTLTSLNEHFGRKQRFCMQNTIDQIQKILQYEVLGIIMIFIKCIKKAFLQTHFKE